MVAISLTIIGYSHRALTGARRTRLLHAIACGGGMMPRGDVCSRSWATPSLRHAPRAKLQRTNPGSSPLSLRGILFRGSGLALKHGVAISMDGRGAWRDNVFVERLWRSVKYEEVYLRAYDSVSEARSSIGRYLAFYNPASEHPSVYAIEVKRLCWARSDPVGYRALRCARSTRALTASPGLWLGEDPSGRPGKG